jgi:hypothetical protein
MTSFLRNQFPIIVLSVVLSFLLWLSVSGQDKTTHDLPVSIDLIGLADNIDLGEGLPDTITLRVNANKAQSSFLTGRKLRLPVDASHVEAGQNTINFDLALVEPPLPRGVDVQRFTPESVTFQAYPYVTREVPVSVPELGQPRDYLERRGDLTVEPMVARVTGPANRLDEIQQIATTPMDWEEVSSPGSTVTVRVQSSDKRLSIVPSFFRVTPNVAVKRKSLTFDVPVRLEDAQSLGIETARVTLRPDEVSVTVSWPLSLPEPSEDSDGGIMATVALDPATLERRKSMRLDVEAVGPNQVEVVRINPTRILAVWSSAPVAEPPDAPAPAAGAGPGDADSEPAAGGEDQ